MESQDIAMRTGALDDSMAEVLLLQGRLAGEPSLVRVSLSGHFINSPLLRSFVFERVFGQFSIAEFFERTNMPVGLNKMLAALLKFLLHFGLLLC
jgi:hypothetical protein